ncbi:hypothetical protein KI387_036674, partial [Taxus chinensis]
IEDLIEEVFMEDFMVTRTVAMDEVNSHKELVLNVDLQSITNASVMIFYNAR